MSEQLNSGWISLASMRSSNWQEIGQTRGPGRQDRENECAETRKAIYLSYIPHALTNELIVKGFYFCCRNTKTSIIKVLRILVRNVGSLFARSRFS